MQGRVRQQSNGDEWSCRNGQMEKSKSSKTHQGVPSDPGEIRNMCTRTNQALGSWICEFGLNE